MFLNLDGKGDYRDENGGSVQGSGPGGTLTFYLANSETFEQKVEYEEECDTKLEEQCDTTQVVKAFTFLLRIEINRIYNYHSLTLYKANYKLQVLFIC